MKLLTKTSLIIITVSLFVFFISGVIFYRLSKTLIQKNVESELLTMFTEISTNINSIEIEELNKLYEIDISRVNPGREIEMTQLSYADTIVFNQFQNQYKPVTEIVGYVQADDGIYEIKIYKSLIEPLYLIENITLALTFMALIFIVAIYITNRLTFEQVWKDFFETLKSIKAFNIGNNTTKLKSSEIVEFDLLNKEINRMEDRIIADFLDLKEFTENISHEIQTPLAIIKSNAELVIQNENLKEKDSDAILKIYKASDRLAKLNQGLLLLTKIENRQYIDIREIDLSEKIDGILSSLEDFIQQKEISVQKNIRESIKVKMDNNLADLLFINLLKNSIQHNHSKGKLMLKENSNSLQISNTGKPPTENPEHFFHRFAKSDKSSKSLGLGLSIVKKICDVYGFEITYSFDNGWHNMVLKFSGIN